MHILTKLDDKAISLPGNAHWMKLSSNENSVEGKLIGEPTGKQLLIFQPGFPGGASRDLESWHLPELSIPDRSIFTIRHNGTLLDSKHASYYLNCPERLLEASKNKEHQLGGEKSYTLQDWLYEPITVLEALSEGFDEIILCGHSFGCLSLAWSLISAPKSLFAKVKKVVFLAGSLGRIRTPDLEKISDPILKQWHEHLDCEWIRERISIGKASDNLKILLDAHSKIHNQIYNYPDIDTILLHPWGDTADSMDERIHVQESLEFLLSLGAGTLIVDKTQRPDKEKDAGVHDLPNLKTSFLNKLLDPTYKPENNLITYTGET